MNSVPARHAGAVLGDGFPDSDRRWSAGLCQYRLVVAYTLLDQAPQPPEFLARTLNW